MSTFIILIIVFCCLTFAVLGKSLGHIKPAHIRWTPGDPVSIDQLKTEIGTDGADPVIGVKYTAEGGYSDN